MRYLQLQDLWILLSKIRHVHRILTKLQLVNSYDILKHELASRRRAADTEIELPDVMLSNACHRSDPHGFRLHPQSDFFCQVPLYQCQRTALVEICHALS